MILLVKCPKCGKNMKVAPRIDVTKATKRCVYCGKSFKIHTSPKDSRIVKRL